MPKLKKIDLSKGKGHHHEDIKPDGTQYLIKYRGRYEAGTFNEQWYGLNFCGGVAWSNQFDTPGSNQRDGDDPRWQGVWEIIEEDTDNERL